jgi:acetoin utilization deacetylase AcuC-like enzyme
VLAGADPYEGDRLGRLALTKTGLRERDVLIRDTLSAEGVPVCVTLAGGYAADVHDTVEINVSTIRVFARSRSDATAPVASERVPASASPGSAIGRSPSTGASSGIAR